MSEDPYDPQKVIEAWDLKRNLGYALRYFGKAIRDSADPIEDLRKARYFLDRHIRLTEEEEK